MRVLVVELFIIVNFEFLLIYFVFFVTYMDEEIYLLYILAFLVDLYQNLSNKGLKLLVIQLFVDLYVKIFEYDYDNIF